MRRKSKQRKKTTLPTNKRTSLTNYFELERERKLLIQVFQDEGSKWQNGTLTNEDSRIRIGDGHSGWALYVKREDGSEIAFTQKKLLELRLQNLVNGL